MAVGVLVGVAVWVWVAEGCGVAVRVGVGLGELVAVRVAVAVLVGVDVALDWTHTEVLVGNRTGDLDGQRVGNGAARRRLKRLPARVLFRLPPAGGQQIPKPIPGMDNRSEVGYRHRAGDRR